MVKRAGALLLLLIGTVWDASPAAAGSVAPFDWSGFYLGYHSGAALDLATTGTPFGPTIFGDNIRSPGPLSGGQLGYNWQSGAFVYGIAADIDWADLQGTNSCFAFSGTFISANCRSKIDALGTLTGRIGWVLPFAPRTLVFGKAGLAMAYGRIDATTNDEAGLPSTRDSGTQWGWTAGGGLEHALSPRWTVTAEYDFLSFDHGFSAPQGYLQTAPPSAVLSKTDAARSSISQDVHKFELGMNYRFGAGRGSVAKALRLRPSGASTGYTLTTGARYVYGWGQFHKDLGIQGGGVSSLASRLTYGNHATHGFEAFGRLDTPSRVMVKGLIGGTTSGGRLNDEDWGLPFPNDFVPYSNTISSVENDVRYGMADVGYSWRRGPGYSLSPFVGYGRFRQNMDGFGCKQIANSNSDCGTPIPTSVLGISEDDVWQAIRLGSSVEVDLTPRLHFSGDLAYLPYVWFNGTDNHVLRDLVSPESGHGIGAQIQATLSYALTDAFSLGVGGRYWAMWTTSGTVNFGGAGTVIPMRYASEQAALLVQGSYRFHAGGR